MVFRSFGQRIEIPQSIKIPLTVWLVLKGSRIDGGCHEANDHSRDNGSALSVRFCSCIEQGFGCDRCTVVPI